MRRLLLSISLFFLAGLGLLALPKPVFAETCNASGTLCCHLNAQGQYVCSNDSTCNYVYGNYTVYVCFGGPCANVEFTGWHWDCNTSGARYQSPSCPAGSNLKCFDPPQNSCMVRSSDCDAVFPSRFYPDGGACECTGSVANGNYRCYDFCQTNCICEPVCNSSAPAAPSIVNPTNGTQVKVGTLVTLDWSDVTVWGQGCPANNNRYDVCISSNQTSCDLANWVSTGTASQYNWTPTVGDSNVTWQARSNNGTIQTASTVGNVCIEGFDASNPAYLQWGACDANHQRTRICNEDCGTDDCTPIPATEDCLGEIRGTIFDASDYSACPAFDPATGYTTGVAGLGASSRSFSMADTNSVAPHPWAVTGTTTDANGNYSADVFAPATYDYDFSALSDILVTGGGPKLTCISSVATVPTSPSSCLTQPCSLVNGMSFGFWKMYGGWWQVVGGSVHGEGGIFSEIPSSMTGEMSLILRDTTEGNRQGFVSYGVPRAVDMLGRNPNAKVNFNGWEKESKYGGPTYDWSFYDKRFNLYTVTDWNEGEAINYNDGGVGYQIFKTNAGVTAFDFSPTGTQKVIFHVNGNVRVTGNIAVPDGAFLAIIASGTITFDQSITSAQGWYVGNQISFPCKDNGGDGCDKDDVQFLGEGSFIGWSGINFGRNRGTVNNTEPAEVITYRQDLYRNAPNALKIYSKSYRPFVP